MLLSFAKPFFDMKYCVNGAVAKMHCNIEFIKHVFPMLRRPVGLYPYPLPDETMIAYDKTIFAPFYYYYFDD